MPRSIAFIRDKELQEFFMQHIRGRLSEIEIPEQLHPGILAETFWALKKAPIAVAISEEDYKIIAAASERLGVSKRLLAVYITIQEMKKFYSEVQE